MAAAGDSFQYSRCYQLVSYRATAVVEVPLSRHEHLDDSLSRTSDRDDHRLRSRNQAGFAL
jgi:hypothetical protein